MARRSGTRRKSRRRAKRCLTVEGKTVKADVRTKAMSFNDFVEAADYAVIEDAYKRAARVISPDLATTYSEHLAKKAPRDEDTEDALIEAHTAVAALGLLAAFVAFLLGPDARFFCGSVLFVDGGTDAQLRPDDHPQPWG